MLQITVIILTCFSFSRNLHIHSLPVLSAPNKFDKSKHTRTSIHLLAILKAQPLQSNLNIGITHKQFTDQAAVVVFCHYHNRPLFNSEV